MTVVVVRKPAALLFFAVRSNHFVSARKSRASDETLYEYACHEGNYAMGNIMRGARLLEKEALEAK